MVTYAWRRTENTVSMNQGNTEAHGGQKRVVHTKFDIYVFFIIYSWKPECVLSINMG
jgi:hypothetical protein